MENKDRPKDIFSFRELVTGDHFELCATTENFRKQGRSRLYTKIEQVSGEEFNGEWTGKANCTYEITQGNKKVIKYSWFPGLMWCKKIAPAHNKDN